MNQGLNYESGVKRQTKNRCKITPIFYFNFMGLLNQLTKFGFGDDLNAELFGFGDFRSTWLSAGD